MKEKIKNAKWGDKFLTRSERRVIYIGHFDGFPCFLAEGEIMPDRFKEDGSYPANEDFTIIEKL